MTGLRKIAILVLAHTVGSLAAVAAIAVYPFSGVIRQPNAGEYLWYLLGSFGMLVIGALVVRRCRSAGCMALISACLPAGTLWILAEYYVVVLSHLHYIFFSDLIVGPILSYVVHKGPLASLVAGLIAYLAAKYAPSSRKPPESDVSEGP